MDRTAKQTALFFGFLASAMTYASAQPAPNAQPAPTAAIERQANDLRVVKPSAQAAAPSQGAGRAAPADRPKG